MKTLKNHWFYLHLSISAKKAMTRGCLKVHSRGPRTCMPHEAVPEEDHLRPMTSESRPERTLKVPGRSPRRPAGPQRAPKRLARGGPPPWGSETITKTNGVEQFQKSTKTSGGAPKDRQSRTRNTPRLSQEPLSTPRDLSREPSGVPGSGRESPVTDLRCQAAPQKHLGDIPA